MQFRWSETIPEYWLYSLVCSLKLVHSHVLLLEVPKAQVECIYISTKTRNYSIIKKQARDKLELPWIKTRIKTQQIQLSKNMHHVRVLFHCNNKTEKIRNRTNKYKSFSRATKSYKPFLQDFLSIAKHNLQFWPSKK